jgi:hypothetical protein
MVRMRFTARLSRAASCGRGSDRAADVDGQLPATTRRVAAQPDPPTPLREISAAFFYEEATPGATLKDDDTNTPDHQCEAPVQDRRLREWYRYPITTKTTDRAVRTNGLG